jgi:hypothetical protein
MWSRILHTVPKIVLGGGSMAGERTAQGRLVTCEQGNRLFITAQTTLYSLVGGVTGTHPTGSGRRSGTAARTAGDPA